ncbi:hypothetical protein B5S30_g2049 [[Candida] boidinii]|nr:hypothetical protein B5S30_g2049 [[Candida] boidinii]
MSVSNFPIFRTFSNNDILSEPTSDNSPIIETKEPSYILSTAESEIGASSVDSSGSGSATSASTINAKEASEETDNINPWIEPKFINDIQYQDKWMSKRYPGLSYFITESIDEAENSRGEQNNNKTIDDDTNISIEEILKYIDSSNLSFKEFSTLISDKYTRFFHRIDLSPIEFENMSKKSFYHNRSFFNSIPKNLDKLSNFNFKSIPELNSLLKSKNYKKIYNIINDKFNREIYLTLDEVENLTNQIFESKVYCYKLVRLYGDKYDLGLMNLATTKLLLQLYYTFEEYYLFDLTFSNYLSKSKEIEPLYLNSALLVYIKSKNFQMAEQLFNQFVMTSKDSFFKPYVLDDYIKSSYDIEADYDRVLSAYKLWLERHGRCSLKTDSFVYYLISSKGSNADFEWLMKSLSDRGIHTHISILLVDLMNKLRNPIFLKQFYANDDISKWLKLIEEFDYKKFGSKDVEYAKLRMKEIFYTNLFDIHIRSGYYASAIDVLINNTFFKHTFYLRMTRISNSFIKHGRPDHLIKFFKLMKDKKVWISPLLIEKLWSCYLIAFPELGLQITKKFQNFIIQNKSEFPYIESLRNKLKTKKHKYKDYRYIIDQEPSNVHSPNHLISFNATNSAELNKGNSSDDINSNSTDNDNNSSTNGYGGNRNDIYDDETVYTMEYKMKRGIKPRLNEISSVLKTIKSEIELDKFEELANNSAIDTKNSLIKIAFRRAKNRVTKSIRKRSHGSNTLISTTSSTLQNASNFISNRVFLMNNLKSRSNNYSVNLKYMSMALDSNLYNIAINFSLKLLKSKPNTYDDSRILVLNLSRLFLRLSNYKEFIKIIEMIKNDKYFKIDELFINKFKQLSNEIDNLLVFNKSVLIENEKTLKNKSDVETEILILEELSEYFEQSVENLILKHESQNEQILHDVDESIILLEQWLHDTESWKSQ